MNLSDHPDDQEPDLTANSLRYGMGRMKEWLLVNVPGVLGE